jgi:hypothetical protein
MLAFNPGNLYNHLVILFFNQILLIMIFLFFIKSLLVQYIARTFFFKILFVFKLLLLANTRMKFFCNNRCLKII